MKTHLIFGVVCLTVIHAVTAIPQQEGRQRGSNQTEGDIQRQIEEVFSPTSSPTVLTVNEQSCTCVPYHMCDPNSNTVKNDASDDEVTGFGVIDIRFDPLDCQDVLDVCCLGVAQREEPIVPKPVENVPTQAAGCGVRNVGGLDFQLAGNFVSTIGSDFYDVHC